MYIDLHILSCFHCLHASYNTNRGEISRKRTYQRTEKRYQKDATRPQKRPAIRVGYKIKLYSRPLDYIGSIHVASGSPIIRQLVANLWQTVKHDSNQMSGGERENDPPSQSPNWCTRVLKKGKDKRKWPKESEKRHENRYRSSKKSQTGNQQSSKVLVSQETQW